jgi:murein DD-endopeptidase MepM/ murein hydrolase activator NlpD
MYRLPFEDDGEWVMRRTNWDDPKDHHPAGQDYAFDIRHSIGGKVRAARGGIVASIKKDNVHNTYDLSEDDPILDIPHVNAGNWITIRHIDGTAASYQHLNPGDVFVEKGDVVLQGQLIALSGNTGHSAGPHLHFEVQSFWEIDDIAEGPGIPVCLEDQNHASFRPVKDQPLASNNYGLRQEDWRRCRKCQGLFLSARQSCKCPEGGRHVNEGGTNFVLKVNTGKAYFFKGDRYRRYDIAWDGVDRGFPAKISKFWQGVWTSDIDAATVWNNGKTYFFKGDHYVRYDVRADKVDDGFPAKISKFWPGLWTEDIDAAVMWHDGKAWFFKGDQCIKWDVQSDKIEKGFPAKISTFWPGLWTEDIDAAVRWTNGKAYFFKGNEYMRWDVKTNKIDTGFPQHISKFWSGLESDIDAAIVWPDMGKHPWRLCRHCGGLFTVASQRSVCPGSADGHARFGTAEYDLSECALSETGQPGWRRCGECAVLFFGSDSESICPSDRKHHTGIGSTVTLSSVVTEVAQHQWSWCQKCQGLFFSPGANLKCPSGSTHIASGAYVVMMNSPGAPGQSNWRQCRNCGGMFFGGSVKSACPNGGRHTKTDANYTLIKVELSNLASPHTDEDAAIAPGEQGWRLCSQCAGLFFGAKRADSACPVGGHHVPTAGVNMAVMWYTPVPQQA